MLVQDVRMHSVSQYTVYRAALLQNSESSHADPCKPLKAPTMGAWTSEPDHGGMEEGSLV